MIRPRRLPAIGLILLCVWAFTARSAFAEHAIISLDVIGPDQKEHATADQEPPAGGYNARPKVAAKAGEPLVLQFILTNAYPHGVVKGVTVRYFVVQIEKPGQKTLPDLKQSVIQGHTTLDFKPGARVGARIQFQVDTPGTYLVRVDTLNTQSDHEHFSALDLEIK